MVAERRTATSSCSSWQGVAQQHFPTVLSLERHGEQIAFLCRTFPAYPGSHLQVVSSLPLLLRQCPDPHFSEASGGAFSISSKLLAAQTSPSSSRPPYPSLPDPPSYTSSKNPYSHPHRRVISEDGRWEHRNPHRKRSLTPRTFSSFRCTPRLFLVASNSLAVIGP